MIELPTWPLWISVAILPLAGAMIAWGGTKLAGFADQIADRTGWGEALTGTLFLGIVTALPGLAASITAALEGYPALAISNAVGGIAIQTTFLAIADIVYTKANLEHAAASVANMIQTAILVVLLTLLLLGLTGPDVTVFHVHPMTPALFLVAGAGFLLVWRSARAPLWRAKRTAETVEDVPEKGARRKSLPKLLAGFFSAALVVTAAGAFVAHSAGSLVSKAGISETLAGGLISAIATSLPELVTTVAAVRRGALTLAVSDIVGGNFFDVLFVFAADLVFLGGSLYHAPAVSEREEFLTGFTILLNVILLLGLLYRQRKGPANIGFESVLILAVYLGGVCVLSFAM